jgi:hypothetical protein
MERERVQRDRDEILLRATLHRIRNRPGTANTGSGSSFIDRFYPRQKQESSRVAGGAASAHEALAHQVSKAADDDNTHVSRAWVESLRASQSRSGGKEVLSGLTPSSVPVDRPRTRYQRGVALSLLQTKLSPHATGRTRRGAPKEHSLHISGGETLQPKELLPQRRVTPSAAAVRGLIRGIGSCHGFERARLMESLCTLLTPSGTHEHVLASQVLPLFGHLASNPPRELWGRGVWHMLLERTT